MESHRKMLAIISVFLLYQYFVELSSLASLVTLISSWNLFDSSVHEMLASGENYESSSSTVEFVLELDTESQDLLVLTA